MPPTRPLDAIEIRVLGALLEKEQTTPDQYPLTINTTITACNQKTNRDPVTQLTETEVVEALDRLRLDVLTWRSDGARAERWEHRLDRRWHLSPARKAVMTLLLLRGPQTPGELKTRSDRMHSFASVGEVEETLQDLARGDEEAMVRELPRAPGQRENRWTHIVGTDEVMEEIESASVAAASAPSGGSAPRTSARSAANDEILERLDAVEGAVEALQESLDELHDELLGLRRRLGDLSDDED